MESAHTNFSEVSWVVLVKEDAVMVLTTGVTATSRVAAVLTDTAVPGTHVSALFAILVQASWHFVFFVFCGKIGSEIDEEEPEGI